MGIQLACFHHLFKVFTTGNFEYNLKLCALKANMTSKRERKCLTLEERVKCIKLLEQGKSSRVVASEVGVGRTQIQNLLKRKKENVLLFLDNAPVHPDIKLSNIKLQFFSTQHNFIAPINGCWNNPDNET